MAIKKVQKVLPTVTIPVTQPTQTVDDSSSKKKVAKRVSKKQVEAPVEEDIVSDDIISEDADESGEKKKRTVPTKESIIDSMKDIISLVDTEISSLRESQTKTKGIKFLRTLNKKLKIVTNQANRVMKTRSSVKKTSTNTNSGFLKPVQISGEMAKFTGWDPLELKSRVDVTKFICAYVKEHNLQNPEDRRQILADAKLTKLLKYDLKKENEPLTYFRVQSCLKNHFPKAVPAN